MIKYLNKSFLIFRLNLYLFRNFIFRIKIKNQIIPEKVIIIKSFPIEYWIKFEILIADEFSILGYNVFLIINRNNFDKYKSISKFSNNIKFIFIDDYVCPTIKVKFKNLKKIEDIKYLFFNGLNIGRLIISSIKNIVLTNKTEFDFNLRFKFNLLFNISITYLNAYNKIIDKYKPLKVFSVEKGDIGSGELFEISVSKKIDFIQYSSCHQPQSIIFKRYHLENKDVHPFSVSDNSILKYNFKNIDFRNEIIQYFHDGYINEKWFAYKKLISGKISLTREEFCEKYNISPEHKNVVIFSHVLNDANLFYGNDLFEGGFAEWLVETIKFASKIENVNWIVKLHPANLFRNKNLGIKDENLEISLIENEIGQIPNNILILTPDTNLNPYSFFKITDVGITVRGTIGAELPCFGIPVITAGTGRYSGKGFTYDPKTKDEYFQFLSKVSKLNKLDDDTVILAQKHAYLFFKNRIFDYSTIFRDNISTNSVLSEHTIDIVESNFRNTKVFKSMINFLLFDKNDDYLY